MFGRKEELNNFVIPKQANEEKIFDEYKNIH